MVLRRDLWEGFWHMRRLWLFIGLILLIGGLITLQSYRFERVSNSPVISLEELHSLASSLPNGVIWTQDSGNRSLRLGAKEGAPNRAISFGLSPIESAEALHITFQLEAKALVCGQENWEDGRLLVKWHASDGSSSTETDPVASVRDHERPEEDSIVVRPTSSPSRPTLHVENLGQSGTLILSKLEITSVRERLVWRTGRWVLLAGWFLWVYFALGSSAKKNASRRALASAIWVGMGVFFIFPGPWANLRPMVAPFDLGQCSEPTRWHDNVHDTKESKGSDAVNSTSIESAKSLGEIEPKEGWILTAKRLLKKQRYLLHILLLFFPTLAFACLLGFRQALILGGMLSLGIEAAQLGFGYGFDPKDIGDLAFDLVGVFAALWVWKTLSSRLAHRTSAPKLEIP